MKQEGGRDGTGRDRMGRDGSTGQDGTDGSTGRDGTGTGRQGTGRDSDANAESRREHGTDQLRRLRQLVSAALCCHHTVHVARVSGASPLAGSDRLTDPVVSH